MTINGPATMLLAYVCVAEEQGVPRAELRGTIQTDILKEYIAQKEWLFPPEPSMRLVVDMIEFCARELPRWHPVSISGYHIREAARRRQSLAFTLMDGFAYLEAPRARPRRRRLRAAAVVLLQRASRLLRGDREVPRGRRIWARRPRDRYAREEPALVADALRTRRRRACRLRRNSRVNNVRAALEALAAVLGGTQSLHTNSFDEALALPTEEAVRIALRTQQVIAHETGVVNTIDPLGPYYVEELDEPARGGGVRLLRASASSAASSRRSRRTSSREIAEASFRYQSEVESGQPFVGVNRYELEDEAELDILRIDPALERQQIERVQALRGERDSAAVEEALRRLRGGLLREGEN